MHNKLVWIALATFILEIHTLAQTTTGLITGSVTDPSGAIIVGAQVDITNQGTGQVRTSTSGSHGVYIMPLLPSGIYNIFVRKSGFASEDRHDVQLEVNQSDTVNFTLGIGSSVLTINVTGAAPLLNTTSATLSAVVDHQAAVDLPLNGREFTQLTLLTPGAAPVQDSQQTEFTVALGAGGISPSVDGQNGEMNDFTMDGVLNNSIYTNSWAIAPPPDAIQEFNVQSHITDAQFSISSGANINVVTRSGTNAFHGSAWEFVRNDVLDANTFPATNRLPYTQNQYGVYLGGPVLVPHLIHRGHNTWFSGYWEGFRSSLSQTILADTITSAMRTGVYSGILGSQVGIDSLGRPEFANEIYDPNTSRPDPNHPGESLRDPFPGNIIPTFRLNPASLTIIQKYYPTPNLNVAEGVLPNLQFVGNTNTASDVFGIRLDHQFNENNTAFIRFNRSNQTLKEPEALPGYTSSVSNYGQQAAVGYTHSFNSNTILTFHYGYTYTNIFYGDEPAGEAFSNSVNFTSALPSQDGIFFGPMISISNGYSPVSQLGFPLGPQEGMDYHADLSKVVGDHTLGIGAMYYHIRNYDNGWHAESFFTQNATAQDALAGPTGFGPASFLLGTLDSYSALLGYTGLDQTDNWYGLYAQDLWRISKRLEMTIGLRWDYVTPPNLHKIVSGLNILNGQFIVTGAVLPYFPNATGPRGYFNPQYNGYEPRFGMSFQAAKRTVLHGAFAILDDHNNTLVVENQEGRLSWPTSIKTDVTSLDLGIPTTYLNNLPLPPSFIGPNVSPTASFGAPTNNKIPYAMEFNAGIQQQLSNSLVMKLDYVGSLSRHQQIELMGNTAVTPGPGPISNRQPFPQYGGPFGFYWNEGPGSYNALQAFIQKTLASGLFFMASYTWSKNLNWTSDIFGDSGFPNTYDPASNWGPGDNNLTNMFVLSGVYALPVGKDKRFMSSPNRTVQALVGNWNIGVIASLHSGLPFNADAGSDIANVGTTTQRAQRNGAYPYAPDKSHTQWLNEAAFAAPAQYTFGNESRNDLTGSGYKDVDFSALKDVPLRGRAKLQFRAEFFNLFNHTNYGTPVNNFESSSFGKILAAGGTGREIQFGAKALF